jgi:uncharacterized phage-associated protein
MFEADKIADYFINLGIINDTPLTNMKLQKVLYLANGIHLAVTGKSLLKDQIEAWKYGPVVRSVYDRFKGWVDKPITSPQNSSDLKLDQETQEILSDVWELSKNVDAVKLSNWTHLSGSPWEKAYNSTYFNETIDPEFTMEYFRDKFQITPKSALQNSVN